MDENNAKVSRVVSCFFLLGSLEFIHDASKGVPIIVGSCWLSVSLCTTRKKRVGRFHLLSEAWFCPLPG